jgi:hypothetical protein
MTVFGDTQEPILEKLDWFTLNSGTDCQSITRIMAAARMWEKDTDIQKTIFNKKEKVAKLDPT